MLPEEGIQKIDMAVDVEEGAAVSFLAHCSFPNAVDVQHLMDARLNVGPNARYSYFERHVHAENGGINVVPKSVIRLAEGARFKTEFELLKGRVGILDMDYSATAEARSQLDMLARIYAREDDRVKIREAAELNGEGATGVLVRPPGSTGGCLRGDLQRPFRQCPGLQGACRLQGDCSGPG